MKKFTLTSILVQDQKHGGFTSFLAELPGVIAEGKTEKEAANNLMEALGMMLQSKKEEAKNSMMDGFITKEVPLKFELSL